MATSPRSVSAEPPQGLSRDTVEELLDLQRAVRRITSTLDLETLIDRVVGEVKSYFDCVESNIYLLNEDAGAMVLTGVRGCTCYPKGHQLQPGRGIVGHVAVTGRTHYAPNVHIDPYYVRCEPAVNSEVGLPLRANGKVIGVLTAAHDEYNAFSRDCLKLLQAFAEHIEIAVENARLFRRERTDKELMSREAAEARAIQQALLPKASPFIPGLSFEAMCVSAGALGGDWYDYIPLSQGRWGIVLADVAGKGMPAALLMSSTRAFLRSVADRFSGPGEVLAQLNRFVLEDALSGKFVTMLYGVIDPARRTLTFASAGHPWPLLIDASGTRFLNGEPGLPLGVMESEYPETVVNLRPGSRLLFYSDGITEAANDQNEEYGVARLAGHLLQPGNSARTLLDDVRLFAGAQPQADDSTAILISAN